MAGPADQPEVVWTPEPRGVANSRMGRFRRWLADERGLDFADYGSRWRWSVTEPEAFWDAVAEFFQVSFHDRARTVLEQRVMPGARWFPGATLNYAEHALRTGPGKGEDDLAVVFRREDGLAERLTFGVLRDRVAALRAGLVELGVRRGDRVVALVPNSPHALVAFLATASLGAIWSSCSPDFGVRAVTDRFAQIEPTVLMTVDGYLYNGRRFDVRPVVGELRAAISSLRATVVIPYLDSPSRAVRPDEFRASGDSATPPDNSPVVAWDDLLEQHIDAALEFEAVPFDHPLWVLYSSGTTGLPKAS